ncbi:tetratricopeptide repeat protein [Wolbachia endosymbiont of Brugia malayi]|uniref:tetratricopeptide repeat protein n=1 Tax=unclassified Wolbachia TaxID=2640676 RepID=UPI0002F3FE11|nr:MULTISPECIES: tetratricopeptide repeat protein [unclassified Wolbachia]QCB61394.1 tetratricopeptide repeat protein [Wolbachia endosymbiont of Brugia malayi]
MNPDILLAIYEMAVVLNFQGKYKDASKYFEEVLIYKEKNSEDNSISCRVLNPIHRMA